MSVERLLVDVAQLGPLHLVEGVDELHEALEVLEEESPLFLDDVRGGLHLLRLQDQPREDLPHGSQGTQVQLAGGGEGRGGEGRGGEGGESWTTQVRICMYICS